MKRIILTDKFLSLATMLAAVFSLTMFSACSEKEKDDPYIKSGDADKPYIRFNDGGDDITTDYSWNIWNWYIDSNIEEEYLKASSDTDWCSVHLYKSGNRFHLSVEVSKNESVNDRKAVVSISSDKYETSVSFIVTQQGFAPNVKFSDEVSDMSVSYDVNQWIYGIITNISYEDLVASSDAEWCSVKMENLSLKHEIRLTVKIEKNETLIERKAVVTVKSKRYDTSVSFTITQNAFEPILSLKEGETIESEPYWSTIAKWTFETNIDIKYIEVECDADWCTFSLNLNNNGINLYAEMEENKSSAVRVANIIIKSTKYDKAISVKMKHQTNPMLFFYWNNDDSYILSCDESLTISKPTIKRNGNNLELNYTLNKNGYLTNFSMWSGSWDGTSGINGTDDTGKNYYNGYPYASSNMMVYIDGKRVGTYGQGQMVTIGNSVKGEIIFVDFPQNATKFSARLQITSNTPNKTFDHDYIDFVNIPVE